MMSQFGSKLPPDANRMGDGPWSSSEDLSSEIYPALGNVATHRKRGADTRWFVQFSKSGFEQPPRPRLYRMGIFFFARGHPAFTEAGNTVDLREIPDFPHGGFFHFENQHLNFLRAIQIQRRLNCIVHNMVAS